MVKEINGYGVSVPDTDKYGIGNRFETNEGYIIEVIERCTVDSMYRYVVFYDDFGAEIRVLISSIGTGRVKNPNHRSICGVGYLGVGGYNPTTNNREYILWRNMLERCYNTKYQERKPSYRGTIVADKLHNFQDFCKAIHEIPFWNAVDEKGKSYELDKDIFSIKMYDVETIVFVPHSINIFFANKKSNKGKFPTGVCFHKENGKYVSKIKIDGEQKYLGSFDTPEQAYEIYCNARNEYTRELAERYKGKIADRVYNVLINRDEQSWS